jgi:hypothetical protein
MPDPIPRANSDVKRHKESAKDQSVLHKFKGLLSMNTNIHFTIFEKIEKYCYRKQYQRFTEYSSTGMKSA